MQFTVPQFIEHDPKIFGPLTFRQSIFVGIALAGCFIFYFTIGKTNLLLFIFISAILLGTAGALAFVKINGRSLPVVFMNIFSFSIGPKLYIWKKKEMAPKFIKRAGPLKIEEKEETKSLRFAEKSRLKKLSNQIETKI
jgi:hypothetical protein